MTPDIWWVLGAAIFGGATMFLFACLQVAGAASDAADRAFARVMLLGVQLPAGRSDWASVTVPGSRDRG